jgi:DNA-binding transcriptional regulator GbsR (MarR family)
MDSRTAQFVERMGLALEADGLPRIAGRIFGLLLVSEDARSLDELAAELRVSKASVSTNARLLEHRGVLEQVSRPADRRDYYRIPRDLFTNTMAQRLARWQRFQDAIGDARASVPIRSREVLNRLTEFEQAYTYMSQIIKEAMAEWQSARNSRFDRVGVSG